MSLASYSDLQSAIASWLARDDLTANIPDFITLAEAGFARRLFRVRQQETLATLTPSSGTVALPSDYLSARRLTWTGSPRIELEYVHPSILQATYPTTPSDIPRIYTIEGGNILIRPVDDTVLELLYDAKNSALSAQLNWLYQNFPDVYLHASLVEAFLFLRDTDNSAIWKSRLADSESEVKSNTFNNAAQLQMRVFGFTP
jgi:hypothetical protein